MKKLLILLAFVCFMPFGGVKAEEPQQQMVSPSYWACYQVGNVAQDNVMLVSDIYFSNGSHDKHVKMFEKTVAEKNKNQDPAFKPVFEPSCFSDNNEKNMLKRMTNKVKSALKRKFTVIQINLTAEE